MIRGFNMRLAERTDSIGGGDDATVKKALFGVDFVD